MLIRCIQVPELMLVPVPSARSGPVKYTLPMVVATERAAMVGPGFRVDAWDGNDYKIDDKTLWVGALKERPELHPGHWVYFQDALFGSLELGCSEILLRFGEICDEWESLLEPLFEGSNYRYYAIQQRFRHC